MRIWEDVLVEVCGIHWRDKRAACSEKRDWELISDIAITQLTHKYKLPHGPAVKAASKNYKPKDDDPEVPIFALTLKDLDCKPELGLVWDCEPLGRVLNGQEKLNWKTRTLHRFVPGTRTE